MTDEEQQKYSTSLAMLTALSDYKNYHPEISYREGMFLNLLGKVAGHLFDVYHKFYYYPRKPVQAIKRAGSMLKVLEVKE
jgi:hypothetical protein